MILKLKEYIKEKLNNLSDFISDEAIDDQFLRIEEIFGYHVSVDHVLNNYDNYKTFYGRRIHSIPYYCICIQDGKAHTDLNLHKELEKIKQRIESMYPKINVELFLNIYGHYPGMIISLK
jgi:hypothetical protein